MNFGEFCRAMALDSIEKGRKWRVRLSPAVFLHLENLREGDYYDMLCRLHWFERSKSYQVKGSVSLSEGDCRPPEWGGRPAPQNRADR
jgi:hypothetical protein